MENKMMMPACYSVMTEDEMTYTSGGDAGTAYAVGWSSGVKPETSRQSFTTSLLGLPR